MKTLLLSLFAISFFLPGDSVKMNYQAEVNTSLPLKSAFQKSRDYLVALPQVDKLSKAKLESNEAEGFIEGAKSFMVYKKMQFYKQPKAEVHYQVRVEVVEGKYRYQFSDFEVYTYKRNRYGKFTRFSSKAFPIEKLSPAKQKELKPLIATEIAHYIERLKYALAV